MAKGLLITGSLLSVMALQTSLPVLAAEPSQALKVLTLGGSVTEIVYALGKQDLLVGVDQASLYPPQAQELPSIGYYRMTPVEGVLRLKPDLVLASEQAGPKSALLQLSSLGLAVESVSDQPTLASLHQRIARIATLLEVPERGTALSQKIEDDLAQAFLIPVSRQNVLVVVLRAGKLLGAGRDTAASAILDFAGFDNALQGYKGYQALSAEFVSELNPDAIVVTRSSVTALGGIEAVRQSPSLRMTSAARKGRLLELDDLLALGIGPRLPLAITQIRQGLTNEQP